MAKYADAVKECSLYEIQTNYDYVPTAIFCSGRFCWVLRWLVLVLYGLAISARFFLVFVLSHFNNNYFVQARF